MSKISQKDIDKGKIILGGCLVSENDPDWQCDDRGIEWVAERSKALNIDQHGFADE